MDFTSRHSQPERATTPAAAPAAPATAARASEKKNTSSIGKQPVWLRAGYMILLVLVALLIAAVLVLLYTERPKPESSFVDTTKLQAVFLNTNPNQVYFGKLVSVNSQYLVLNDIYYLQTSSSSGSTTSTNSSVSLIKLGCELHQPYDQMVLNRDQVSFWENIKDDGQVAKAVAAFQKANPNGQKCSTQTSSSTNQSTNNEVQNSGTGSGSTTDNSSNSTTKQ